jgi:membrane protease YdiL (CAAX protease family)
MADVHPASAHAPVIPPPADMAPTPAPPVVPRNTVRDTWAWLWKDTLGRVVPFAAAAALYARLSGGGPAAIGLTAAGWPQSLALGLGAGLPMAAAALLYRMRIARSYRLPTPADQALQTAFYFAVNAPAEELFWRGTIQTVAIRGLALIPGLAPTATMTGWALTTVVFGAYHRLGQWSWRAIAGVTVAGGIFGALYLWLPQHSILAPTLVHGFATAGFLSWGDAALYLRARHAGRRR